MNISLRDYFAGLAMQAEFSRLSLANKGFWRSEVTKAAYEMADAMLKERGEKKEDKKYCVPFGGGGMIHMSCNLCKYEGIFAKNHLECFKFCPMCGAEIQWDLNEAL